MYSFVDQIRQHRQTLLLILATITVFAVVCQGQESSFSLSISSGEPLLPCVYRGQPYLHAESWSVDECTICSCDNATTTCVIESCQPAFCVEPIKPEGECCFLCPFNVKVKKVAPVITSTGSISEGRENRLTLRVPIKFQEAQDTTGVAGEGLWRLSAWASPNMDGRGQRFGYQSQTLTEAQQAKHYKKKDSFNFQDVDFRLTDPMAQCTDMMYICTRLDRGESPRTKGGLDYEFSGFPDDNALTGCTTAPECKGVQARGLSWRYTADNIIAGMENELSIDATVLFTDTTAPVTGNNLWRLALYGSKNLDGSGERFNYNEQTLNNIEVSKNLEEGGPLEFTEATAMFDVAAIGCGPFGYACMDFTRNDDADPFFGFSVLPEGDVITLCQESPCRADLSITRVQDTVLSGTVIDGRDSNAYSMDVAISGAGVGVAGNGLWKLNAFGSSNANGAGQRYSERSQVLTSGQQDQTFRVTEDMLFSNVDFDLSMRGLTCAEVQFVCVEFAKGDSPDTVFNLIPVPDDSVMVSCSPAECEGVFAEDLEWTLEPVEPVFPGEESSVSLDSTVTFRDGNRELVGSGLWRQGLFGSRNRDGSGERFNYKRQTLDRPQASTTLIADSPLEVQDAITDFEIGTVGCNDFNYLCLEFTGGDNPNPDYFFRVIDAMDNSAEANTLVKCKEQECLSKAIFTDLEADLGNQIIYENKRNPLSVDLTGVTHDDATNVRGDQLWKMAVYGSRRADGSGPKAGLEEQILDPTEASTTLLDEENLMMNNVNFEFDMTGIRCEDAEWVCFDLDKNNRASVNYIFEARPDESVITECIDMRDRCKGVTAIDIDWEADVGDAPFGQPSPLTLTADINFDPLSPDVNGQGLWQLGVFAATRPDGDGPRRDEISQTLDPFNGAKPLEEGGPLEFDNVLTNFPIDELGCDDYRYLCVEFKQGVAPTPGYKFETQAGTDSIISCREQPCRGVEVSELHSQPTETLSDLILYEGKDTNPIQYNSVATTTPDSGTVRGVDLWTLSQWGSERANGNGPQQNYQEEVLSGYHAALPVMAAGDTLDFVPLATNFDMTGLRCPQVKYICNELSKDPRSRPDFEFTAVPDETVLRSCFEVPDGACKGVVFTDLDWDMSHGPVSADGPDDVRFNVDVSTLPESGGADGDGLWRIGVFGAQNPQGTGPRLDYKRQILTRGQSSTPAEGEGMPLELNALETEFDLSQIGCDSEYRWLCLEFAKGLRASPDFEFEINGGGDVIISCKEQPCRRPVMINDVETNPLGNVRVNEGTRNNRILYEMTALTDPSSGKAQGKNLWEMSTFGSSFPDGRGRRFNPQTAYTFTQYQKDKSAFPGENIRYGAVDTNMDMTGLTCNDVRYFCSELRKGDYPSPDFEMIANPTEDVLTDCFELNCEGVLIDNTRLSLNSDSELSDGPNDLSFDFTVNSNPTGGDAAGNNLWRLETFTSNNNDGSGRRDILRTQTLDPADASYDLDAGNTMVFRNLEALVDSADVNCEEDYYLCAELSKHVAASSGFSMRATRENALTSCRLIRCAKAAPPPVQGRPGPKGAKGEPFDIPPGMVGPPGRPGLAGSVGYHGRRGPNGLSGPAGQRGEDGRDGNSGNRGTPGPPGPPGPPGEMTAAAQQSKGPAYTAPIYNTAPGRPGSAGYSGHRGARGPQGLTGPMGPQGSAGPMGMSGPRGARGEDGEDGNDGQNGRQGEIGLVGISGRPGLGGMHGMSGNPGHKGWGGRHGAPGAAGERGEAGEGGNMGASGPVGAVGNPGQRGPSGSRGGAGSKGPMGDSGERGSNGEQGPTGNMGPLGPSGLPGANGATGDSGMQGGQGSSGPVGLVGESGSRGKSGSAGAPGIPGSSGDSGIIGEMGIQGEVGGPGRNGAPGLQGSIGPVGIGGERGDAGLPGYMGLTGSRGPAGPSGARGIGGEPGPAGNSGSEGETGSTGPSGPRGPMGELGMGGGPGMLGAPGNSGFMGDQGESGEQGSPGEPGSRGTNGEPGTPGQTGPNGAPGEDGLAGNDGKTGATGTPGRSGPPGANGDRGGMGPPGAQGPPGIGGETGFNGNTGIQGTPGTRGEAGVDGEPGAAGQSGLPGSPGNRGDSGTQGPVGIGGSQGAPGQPGLTGTRGARGNNGPSGPRGGLGVSGDAGEQGLRGAAGLQGASGIVGERGTEGRSGRNGEVGPTGIGGSMGQPGLRGLPGPPGLRGGVGGLGEMGTQGDRGPSGPSGPSGRTGEAGGLGPLGPMGVTGQRGDNGNPGDPGPNGPSGLKGTRGAGGEKGSMGSRGIPGNPGPGGAPGERGPSGLNGEKGEAGPFGSQGRPGRSGPQGNMGARGERGETGNQGALGPSGSSGMNGPPGVVGEPGPTGPVGPTGRSGEDGRMGSRGPQGNQGVRGPPGVQGLMGSQGSSGEDGRDGHVGPPGPMGAMGQAGNLGNLGSHGFMGPPGPAGPQGRPGVSGEAGRDGANGERGEGGRMGPSGPVGVRGMPGSDGRDGKDGPAGPVGLVGGRGDTGAKGNNGMNGLMGPRGPSGIMGAQGERGNRGKQGAQGSVGNVGESGGTGPMGSMGPAGARGEVGSQGATGHKGQNGMPGMPGMMGVAGEPGNNGEGGPQGIRGIPGVVGEGGKSGRGGPRGPPGLRGGNGGRGERGNLGPSGPPGPAGPPGPPGEVSMAAMPRMPQQQQSKGPSQYSHYYRDEIPKTVEQLDRTQFQIYLAKFESEILSLIEPLGSRDQPIRSCKDLFKCYPEAEDGNYWIDSNEGSVKDAFLAHCVKRGESGSPETCITPRVDEISRARWYEGASGSRYITEMGLEKFSYEASEVQLTFLRLLSTKAHQNVTYHCKNSVAVRDRQTGSTEQALRLMTTSDVELSLDAPSQEQYEVIEDGCQERSAEWSQTVINYSTRRNTRLPIVDVAPSDIGGEGQEFGITLGPVCFS
ncbi:alpha-2 collagen isoform X1 [Strongylocentrotus purpuratus]|uniref:Alpha-2 collagen n=1 Tax=Strongylocentrotus purpuratus TaxID=7668 RepID=A0A7M7T5M8_STRPU|nr:alpha-2 collagen isoform X1 [Strongylocentrotus purpuratus]